MKPERETRKKWKASLEAAIAQPEEPVLAITFRRSWNSAARPVLVRCIDKNEYVIKGQQAGRQIINDQSSPNWTENHLIQAPSAELDQHLFSTCKLTTDEVEQALLALKAVNEETIIQAVAAPPSEWGLIIDERVTLVEYLIKGQQVLLERL